MTDSRSTWTHAACPLVLAVGLLLAPTRVLGAEQAILGSQVIIKNPGPPEMRKIVVDAKEKASGNSIVGDPVAHGATLTIRAEGETTTSQSFHLPAAADGATGRPFWSGDAVRGYTYRDGSGANGSVRSLKIRRTGNGTFLLTAKVDARSGRVDVVPPGAGTGCCVMLGLGGGDAYSVRFVDGAMTDDGMSLFKVRKPTSKGTCSHPCGTFVTTWGRLGSGNGQLHGPNGVTVDADGNVFVGDFENNRIQKFTGDGDFLATWGSEGGGNGQFQGAAYVALAENGDVLVADYNNNRIQRFTNAGTFLATWGSEGSGDGQFVGPTGIAVDASGNVFVADSGNDRVQKFSSTGAFLGKWGGPGNGDGQFKTPLNVAVDGHGNVFVVDLANHRVQKFTNDGAFLGAFGGFGTGDGQLAFPAGLAVDAHGNVFVSDRDTGRVQKFTGTGTFITKWGGLGSDPGEFRIPVAIAVDVRGSVFVADYYNDRVQKFACPE